MSKPTTPSSRCRTATSAISTERAAWRMAVTMSPTVIERPSAPRRKPSEHRLDHFVEREAAIGQELGRHPHLGVDDPIRGEVLDALGAHAFDRIARLHHCDGMTEALEIELEGFAVGAEGEPARKLIGIGRRQLAIPDL